MPRHAALIASPSSSRARLGSSLPTTAPNPRTARSVNRPHPTRAVGTTMTMYSTALGNAALGNAALGNAALGNAGGCDQLTDLQAQGSGSWHLAGRDDRHSVQHLRGRAGAVTWTSLLPTDQRRVWAATSRSPGVHARSDDDDPGRQAATPGAGDG